MGYDLSGDYMLCPYCEERTSKYHEFCQNCGKEIVDYDTQPTRKNKDYTKNSTGKRKNPQNNIISNILDSILNMFTKKEPKQNYYQQKRSLNAIDNMTGREFEIYLSNLFKNRGYNVELTPESGDYGADLVIQIGNIRTVVQAKRHKNPIGNKAIQEAYTSINHYGANNAIVVTNSRFTNAAKKLASSNQVKLIDRDGLRKL